MDAIKLKPAKTPNAVCITPTHLFHYDCQPLWIWYECFGDPAKKEPLSSFALRLMEDGVNHESQIIQNYQFTAVEDVSQEAAIQSTLNLMKKGEPLIYQGTIQAEIDDITYYGRPDILKRIEGVSSLGNWTCEGLCEGSGLEVCKKANLADFQA